MVCIEPMTLDRLSERLVRHTVNHYDVIRNSVRTCAVATSSDAVILWDITPGCNDLYLIMIVEKWDEGPTRIACVNSL